MDTVDKYSRAQQLELLTAQRIVKEHAPKNVQLIKENLQDNVIYRTVESYVYKDYNLVDPRLRVRQSRNTTNLYTLLVDNSSDWSNFPKRSRGIISYLDIMPQDHGYEFLVIPFDTATFGLCPAVDFWLSFNYLKDRTGIAAMDTFNAHLGNILSATSLKKGDYYSRSGTFVAAQQTLFETYDDLKKGFKQIDGILRGRNSIAKKNLAFKINSIFSGDFEKNYKGDFLSYINELLNPYKNMFLAEFSLEQLFNQPTKSASDFFKLQTKEVWTDCKSLLVKLKVVNTFFHNFP